MVNITTYFVKGGRIIFKGLNYKERQRLRKQVQKYVRALKTTETLVNTQQF